MPSRLWDSEGNADTVLRRLAIVLQDVPPATYLKVMAFLDDETSKLIKDSISNLGHVDHAEKQQAFELFNASFQLQKEQCASEDSLQLSNAGYSTSLVTPGNDSRKTADSETFSFEKQAERFRATAAPEAVSELRFLSDMDSELLSDLLQDEHPQTLALVLASIKPAAAAGILGHLRPALQHETMVRIRRLGNIPHAVFEEVAEHLRSRLDDHQSLARQTEGTEALKAIMEEMPTSSDPSSFDVDDAEASHQLLRMQGSKVHLSSSSADRLQRESDISSRNVASNSSATLPVEQQADLEAGIVTNEEEWTTQQVHDYLIGLSPKTFCLALSHVPTREALLVLSSVPKGVADRIVALLSRSQARSVKRKMLNVQTMSLTAMDEAKRKVAKVAVHMAGNTSLSSKSA